MDYMRILYTSSIKTNHFFNIDLIAFLKKITYRNKKEQSLWNNVNLTLLDDKNNVVWIKKFKDIKEEDINAYIN